MTTKLLINNMPVYMIQKQDKILYRLFEDKSDAVHIAIDIKLNPIEQYQMILDCISGLCISETLSVRVTKSEVVIDDKA